MAVAYNPGIVTEGLILCLDAANRNSYPSTGTAWTDISNTGNNGILKNGPTYSTLNGGNINFDGTDDTVDCGPASQIGASLTGLTVEVFLRTSVAGLALILENGNAFTADTFYLAKENATQFTFLTYGGGGYDRADATVAYQTNTWYHLVGVWKSNVRNQIYMNGVNVTSHPVGASVRTTLQNGNTNLFIASRSGTLYNFPGDIPIVRIYNIALSDQQISQNFNAMRGRFGI